MAKSAAVQGRSPMVAVIRWAARHRILAAALVAGLVVVIVGAVVLGAVGAGSTISAATSPAAAGIHKIKHVVVIMQENRSFDSYFGTFPGADGIPAGVCVPDPAGGSCQKPFHDPADKNAGGPHGAANATADIDGGAMDGFIGQAEQAKKNCAPNAPACSGGTGTDVMGYKTGADIPNYWAMRKTSCSTITCSSRTRRGAFPLTCTWCRSGQPNARRRGIRRAA